MNELAIEGGTREPGVPARTGVDLLAVARQAEQVKALGATLIASGLLPDSIKKPEAAVAVMLKGAEIGVGPMYALSNIAIISGKPTLTAELMSALVRRAGHKIRIIESTDRGCTVEGIRRDDPGHGVRITFDHKDAERAGLLGKGPWKQYPGAMYASRAISKLCKIEFSDVVAGFCVPEELGAGVDEDGRIVDDEPEAPIQGEVEGVEAHPGPSRASEKQANYLKGLMRQAGVDRATVEERYGPVEELSPSRASRWIEELRDRLGAVDEAEAEIFGEEKPPGEAERQRSSEPRPRGYVTDEQLHRIQGEAARIYPNAEDAVGIIERQIGHSLNALSRGEAGDLIADLGSRPVDEEVGND